MITEAGRWALLRAEAKGRGLEIARWLASVQDAQRNRKRMTP